MAFRITPIIIMDLGVTNHWIEVDWTGLDCSGVARTSPLLGHSMGTLRLYELPRERSAEAYRGVWRHPPPQILQPPRSVLRPYTIAKCKSRQNSRV